MGTWGTAISSNDIYADIYGYFFELYDDGEEVDEISKKLIAENSELINDVEDAGNFWFALSKAQWECNSLDNYVLSKVKTIIDNGHDIEVWRNQGASEKDIEKRKQVLINFLAKINSRKVTAKKRKKKKTYIPAYEKGDCLTFKLFNGNYGGALVLEKDCTTGNNLIVPTLINTKDKPTRKDFKKASGIIREGTSLPYMSWYHPAKHEIIVNKIEVCDILGVEKTYTSSNCNVSYMGDFDAFIINKINQTLQTTSPASKKISIQALIKKKWWKLW